MPKTSKSLDDLPKRASARLKAVENKLVHIRKELNEVKASALGTETHIITIPNHNRAVSKVAMRYLAGKLGATQYRSAGTYNPGMWKSLSPLPITYHIDPNSDEIHVRVRLQRNYTFRIFAKFYIAEQWSEIIDCGFYEAGGQ